MTVTGDVAPGALVMTARNDGQPLTAGASSEFWDTTGYTLSMTAAGSQFSDFGGLLQLADRQTAPGIHFARRFQQIDP